MSPRIFLDWCRKASVSYMIEQSREYIRGEAVTRSLPVIAWLMADYEHP